MHEMALAESVVQVVEDHARAGGFRRVRQVRLEIGAFSGVEIEAMRFCFDVVTRGSVAEAARLEIIALPGQGWCLPCGKTIVMAQRFDPCPDCGSHQVQVTGGDDMRIKDLEVE